MLIAVAATWFWYIRSHTPALTSVNGVYANPCCNDITLKDGVLYTGTAQVPFELKNMKFGLTIYPAKRLEVNGTHVDVRANSQSEALLVDPGEGTITVCGARLCGKTYAFERR